MSVRRSLDPTSSKPFNINIYYNINSKNITNNHEVLSHPVTARGLKNGNEEARKNQPKPNNNNKIRKKKYSVDLGMPTDKRGEKGGKKSNTNSICSGFPSQANYKKESEKNEQPKKAHNANLSEKHQFKLGQLLQIFSEGKIDKTRLTKQIINIFQLPDKGSEEIKQKKIAKKKRSLSTLMGTATPKNNQQKLQQGPNSIKTVLNIHKVRRQTKSQRGSFSNSKNIMFKNQITQKIIECKNVDSSLFLQPDQEEMIPPIVDRTNDVQTSYSIVLLNQTLKQERKAFPESYPVARHREDLMAARIQRAWRKYKTKSLISNFLESKQKFPSESNSLLQKVECVSSKNSMEVQNYLSQELNRRKAIKQTEIARVEELRDHQINKWNQIIDYVRISINNKGSSDQCLKQIIEYFENAKNAVEKELLLDRFELSKRERQESIEFTQFTNQVLPKEGQISENQDPAKQDQDISVQNFIEEEVEERSSAKQKQSQGSELGKNLFVERVVRNLAQKSEDLSFEVVESTLMLHLKKLATQYEQKIQSIDINSAQHLEMKQELEKQYQRQKKQIKRIISNLNKGYAEAKNILQKGILIGCEQNQHKNLKGMGSSQILQKCKSDNYLLKTAINYKRYIEKKERDCPQESGVEELVLKPLTKVKYQDNLELKSIESSELSQTRIKKSSNNPKKAELESEDISSLGKGGSAFDRNEFDGGEGHIFNSQNEQKFSRLEEKIFSEEFLQYEQIHKRFEEEEDRAQGIKQKQRMLFGAEYISLFQNTKLNQNSKKLKYLTSEDKDDIFEFLFIDLSLELVTQCDQQSNVYKSIKNYIEKRKRLQLIPKGIKTSLPACKQYLAQLSNLVVSEFLELFLSHIVVSMGPTAREMLKYMHEEQYVEKSESNEDFSVPLILPVQIFQKLSTTLRSQYPRIFEDEAKEQSRVNFLKYAEHAHQKALFDALNQSLDAERPYGFLGRPFPWKTSCKNRINFDWSKSERIQKMQNGVEKVIQCCSYMCGILTDKEESLFGHHKVSQSYVQQIREDRMSKMLANQLLENEEKWSFFDDEETEASIQLSRLVELALLHEIAQELIKL